MRRQALCFLVVVVALAVAAPNAAALTRGAANQVALRALGAAKGKRPLIVFGLDRPLKVGTRVYEAGPGPSRRGTVRVRADGTQVFTPRDGPVKRRTWLFWEDLAPRAHFQHHSVLVLVDDRTGRVSRKQVMTFWPLVNGRRPAFLATARGYEAARYRVLSRDASRPRRARAAPSAWTGPLASAAQSAITGPPDVSRECLIHLGDFTDPNFAGDFEATEQMARTLGLRRQTATGAADLEAKITAYEKATPPCRDVIIWISAHGYAATGSNYPFPGTPGSIIAESANAQVGLASFVVPATGGAPTVRSELFTGPKLRAILGRHASTKFKLVVDACFSGRWRELSDVANLRAVLSASRSDQMAYGFIPNGTYAITPQQNAVTSTPGGSVNVDVNNPTQSGGFTNAIVRGIDEWSLSADQRASDGEDLGKALIYAFGREGPRDASRLRGLTAPELQNFVTERPDVDDPTPPPAPGTYSVTLELSYRHGPPSGPGGAPSEVCVRVRTSPARQGSARVRLTGPGVASGGDQTVALGGDGTAFVRVGINQYGDYTAGGDVTASGVERTGAGLVTVTGAPGTCPSP